MQTDQMERLYEAFCQTWASQPQMRGGRSNIINLNLILVQFMLHVGGQAFYDAHYPDFTQIKPGRKWQSLFRIFQRIMLRNHILPFVPIKRLHSNSELNNRTI